jgi:hypothetical protein
VSDSSQAKPFWISWWARSDPIAPFALSAPWWISGYRGDGADSICAAVRATDEESAKAFVRAAHDDPSVEIQWRFAEERPIDWAPFGDRFPRAAWMVW